ncbi:hypothetical protein V1502_03995 [Bacillus sp. SCS-153A]|uniref:hypothetical protein n=1 Tax=Rossellomorea sedimentorum TaxID=3115294 RepID=UPI003905C8FE
MNRFLFLAGFILLAILTNSIGNGHFSVNIVAESSLLDQHMSDHVEPGEHLDSGNSKAVFNDTLVLLVLLMLCLTALSNWSAFHRRMIVLTPIFYQSNYVDQSLFNNQSTI